MTILTEIQMQNPQESLDMKGLLDQVQQSVGVTKTSVPSHGDSRRDEDTLEEIEVLYKEREERLRSAHAEHVEELEARISSLLERRRAMLESHREELEEERERRRREMAEQSEEHKDAMQGWMGKRWALGCVNLPPTEVESQDRQIVLQLRSYLFSHPGADFEIRVHRGHRPHQGDESRRGRGAGGDRALCSVGGDARGAGQLGDEGTGRTARKGENSIALVC